MSNTNKPRPTIKAVRGTRDLLPDQTPLWNKVEATARAVFARYGFGEIRTPIFESTELFARGVGEETDIVSKEMFTWSDGERFDDKALLEAWTKVQIEVRHSVVEEAAYKLVAELKQLGVQRIIGRRNPERPEFVCFRLKVTAEAIETLLKAKQAIRSDEKFKYDIDADYFRKFGPGLRLVVPAGSEKPAFDVGEVIVEEFPGDFFKSSQSLTLRPESTAGVVRAYIEHKLGETGQLQKLYYIGPQFRRERPQRGRYRQFWQIGAEVLGPQTSGSDSPLRDAEILEMLASLLDELGIRDWRLELNSVGNTEDRARYNIALKEALAPVKHLMCPDNQRRAETNPLRVLDSKDEADQEIINALPKIADYLGPDSAAHFQQVLAALDACSVPYHLNPRLVRGLDYYTRTTFEFTVTTGLGTQNAMLGGGRYDGLSEMLGGPKAPGIGFAIGEDRLILTLQAQAEQDERAKHEAELMARGLWSPDAMKHIETERQLLPAKRYPLLDAYIAPLGIAQNPAALKLARDLRAQGLTIEVGDGSFKIGKSFGFADAIARNIILLGENEVASDTATVKTFATGEQVKIERSQISNRLKS